MTTLNPSIKFAHSVFLVTEIYVLFVTETIVLLVTKNSALLFTDYKPIAEAINTAVVKSFEGIEGFLKGVCAPACEEVGLLLKDQLRFWRLNNILNILQKAKGKLEFVDDKLQIKSHPRIALSIIENGSLNDNDEIQELWAGLFASSCSIDGEDDENLIFIDILKQLTVVEARIIKYACENGRKIICNNGLIISDELTIECTKLFEISRITNLHRLDRELDHLRSLDLIAGIGGFSSSDAELNANISPSGLALNLYLKFQGYNGDPTQYWKTNIVTYEDWQKEMDSNHPGRDVNSLLTRMKEQSDEMLEKMQAFSKKIDTRDLDK